jgi:hypothetical protein
MDQEATRLWPRSRLGNLPIKTKKSKNQALETKSLLTARCIRIRFQLGESVLGSPLSAASPFSLIGAEVMIRSSRKYF